MSVHAALGFECKFCQPASSVKALLQVMGPIAFLNQGGTYLTAVLAVWAATGMAASAGLLAKRGAK